MAEKVVIGNAELWHGDCREVLPLLADAFGGETSSVDLAEALKCPLPVAQTIMAAAMACAMGEIHPHDEEA